VRDKSNEKSYSQKSLSTSISSWKRAHPEIEKEKSVRACIDDIYAERGRPPTTDELRSRISEVREESNEKSCSESSLSPSRRFHLDKLQPQQRKGYRAVS